MPDGLPLLKKMMDIEVRYFDLEQQYDKLTVGDKPSNRISVLIFDLMAAATLGAVLYYLYLRQYPRPLMQWVILICGAVSWPMAYLSIKGRVKGYGPTAEYKAKKKSMEQEMKSIRSSEEYKAAKKRRNEMQSRVDSWKKQMRAAVKTK